MTKIIFLGTPNFVLPIPQVLLKAGYQLAAIVTNPDRPVGRHAYRQAGKQILTPSPVKAWAQKNSIPVFTPEKLDPNFQLLITNYQPDLFILAAYGKILPQELLALPKYGALCIHPSLLPKYRGASPVQTAIAAGDKITGVSLIKMDAQMDHGPIVAQLKEEIKPSDTAETLYQRLFQTAAQFIPSLLSRYINFCADRHAKRYICQVKRGNASKLKIFLPPKDQNHEKATFTKILKKEDGFIPPGIIAPKPGQTSKWKLGPYNLEPTRENLARFIRAMHPWPGAYTKLKIKPFDFAQGENEKLKIIKFLPEEKIQVEGGKPMSYKDFLNGYPEAKKRLKKLLIG